jgi:hypothetical protein
VPEHLISDSGGAFISEAFEGVCTRLGIDHHTIVSTEGQSYMNLMETHFNIQRRVYDYQLALTRTPPSLKKPINTSSISTTPPPIRVCSKHSLLPHPLHVLGEVKGRLYTPQELERKFAHALFPRTTNRYGCVTLHHYHFYVDQGLPQQQVLLWVHGQELRAVFEQVLLAEYHCHYALREGKVKDIRVSQVYPSPFAARQAQGLLLERHPRESMVVYRPQSLRRPATLPLRAEQLWLFERFRIA